MSTLTKDSPIRHAADKIASIDDHTILAEVPISEMFVAPYGRPISAAQIGRMLARGLDAKKLGIITLSMRADGRYAILDGHHRRRVAEYSGMTEMLARVFIDLTYEEEAELFEALNTTKPQSAVDHFRAQLEYNDPVALGIQHLLRQYGFTVQLYFGHGRTGGISCVAALKTLYLERGPQEFAEVISILKDAWDYEPQAYVGAMIDGMRLFWARYRDRVNRPRLIANLQLTTPRRLLAKAGAVSETMREPTRTALGREVMKLYNGRATRNRLPDWPERIRNPGVDQKLANRIRGQQALEELQMRRQDESGG